MEDDAGDGWARAASLTDVPDGKPVDVMVGDEEVLLYRRGDEVFAIGNRCTHQRAQLHRGRVQSLGAILTVTCPAHGSMFALKDGRVLRGPAMRRVPAYEARLRGDQIEIRRVEQAQGPTRSSAT